MSHTPGPWSAHEDDTRHADYIRCQDDCPKIAWFIMAPAIVTETLVAVAAVYQDDGDADADARLIAAAPDLAESCENLLAAVRHLLSEFLGRVPQALEPNVILAAEMALRKAGRRP